MASKGGAAGEIRILQVKLDLLKSDCGCGVGIVVLILSMGAYVHYFFDKYAGVYGSQQKAIAGILIFFASAAVGKAFGILLARYRYSILKRHLAARLHNA
jgi:hypothetical protein